MKKSYLLAYNATVGSREEVKTVLDGCPFIETWRYDIPNTFYLVSESSAREISDYLFQGVGNKGQHVVTEIMPTNYWGRSSNDTWHLIKNKQVKPKS
jgi:hypothetical protein